MPDAHHDYAGRLLTDPARLARLAKIDELRKLAGALQGGGKPDPRAAAWLGRALADWLHMGGDLGAHLGIRPPRGSHATVRGLLRQEERDRALLRLATLSGGDAQALKILRGARPCPPMLAALLAALNGVARGAGAIGRARRRLSRHQ